MRLAEIFYNKKVDLSEYYTKTESDNKYTPIANTPFSFGIDSSGNYGYKKAGADTVIPFKSQSDIDNAYNKGITDGKSERNPMFGAGDTVGTIGTITDGIYNVK